MRQTLRDFGYNLSKVPLLCDNESAIRLADNSVEHSHTKNIDIRLLELALSSKGANKGVNSGDNRVTCSGAIALLIWPLTGTVRGYL
jgi:hypothetical protein